MPPLLLGSIAPVAVLVAAGVYLLASGPAVRDIALRAEGALSRFWLRRAGENAKHRAEVLGWPPYRVPLTAALWAIVFTGAVTALSRNLAPVALVASLPIGWGIASSMLATTYRSWQASLQRSLPGLITGLRVHLDLGATIPDAIRQVIDQAPPDLAAELSALLADMATSDRAKHSLSRLADRVDTPEWRMTADILAQAWDTATSGAALEPLVKQAATARERAAAATTGKLDMAISAAPGLALLAVMIWGGGGYLLTVFTGHGGL